MGISDDIAPKRSHRRLHSYSSYSPKDEPVAKTTDFVKIEKEEDQYKPPISEIISDASDDFFARDQKKTKTEPVPKDENHKTTRNGKRLSGWILVILLICLSVFLVINNFQKIKRLFVKNIQKTTTTSNQTNDTLDTYVSEIKPQDYTDTTAPPTTAPTNSTATANTAAVFDKTTLKIQILNGNGITNSASLIKKTLETAGFKIASTGNASNFAYADTFVYYKTGKEEGANLIKDALKDRTVIIEKSDTKVKTYDIVVVIGKK